MPVKVDLRPEGILLTLPDCGQLPRQVTLTRVQVLRLIRRLFDALEASQPTR